MGDGINIAVVLLSIWRQCQPTFPSPRGIQLGVRRGSWPTANAKHMAESKPPKPMLTDDKAASVSIWRKKFNAWLLLQRAWEDTSKSPTIPEHWVAEKSTMRNCSILPRFPRRRVKHLWHNNPWEADRSPELGQPWIYQQRLEDHFVGQDDVMLQRLAFFNSTSRVSHPRQGFKRTTPLSLQRWWE